jgi:RHS repeat-associated protein
MLLVFAQTQCAPGTPTNSPTSTATNTPGPPTATPCPPLTIDGEITTNDLRMFGRLADTTPSTCAVTGTLPGLLDNLPRRYDGYKYSNTSDSAICVTVSFNANCTTQMGSAAYLGSFDPNEVTHNYLASSGGPGSATYSFQVPAAATFEVIVYGRDPSTTCSTYTLVVDGDCTLAPRHNVSGDQTLGGGSNVIRNNRCDQCDPVNTASGNFWQTIEDLSVAGRGAPGAPGIPLDFSRTYNSQATELNGPMGYGWTHSYNIYLDYEGTNTIRPTPVCTAVAVLVGHVTWQGIPQPNARSQLPLTLTIKTGTSERNYPNQTTDQDGFFTVTVSGLANGPYDWRIKGTRSLASSGVLTVTGATTLNVEMGVMRGGDANNDNVISIVDQNILKNTFGKGVGDPGYDTRADFNNDTTVNSLDFNIMKANFGTGGAPPITPLEGLKAANSKMHLVGFKPSNVPTAQAMKLWLAPGATPEPDMTNTIKVAVREGTGGSVPFTNTGDPLYHHDPEIMAELYQNPDETYVYTQTHGQLQYAFNASGFLTQISDRNHYTTTLHYNGFNELDQVTEPGGRMLVFTYTCGFLTTVADTTGRSAYFGYNSNSDLTDVIDAANNFTHYEYYTTTHRLKTITHPSGGTLTNVYDKSNRVVRQDEAVSPGITRTTQFEYITPTVSLSITPSLGITSTTIITDPLGYVTVHEYNDYQLERVTQNARGPNPPVWEYSYGQSGYPLGLSSATDPNKHTSTNTWDAKGNLLTSSDPLGHVTGYGYNATNDLAVITNSVGMTTTYGYDGNGNLTSVTRPLTQTNQLAMTTVEYDPNPARPSDVLTITNPLGNKWKYAHDPATGYVLTGTNPLTETTRYSYDGAGHVVSLTSPRGYTSTLAYNAYGDPLRITNTLGYTFTYIYDRERNLTSASDANNHAITYTYDLMSRRTRVTQPDGTHSDYGYDLNGNLITQTNALTQTMLYAYNGLNRLVGATEAVSSTNPITRSYQYDAAGNLTVITDAVGLTTTFGYDNANRLAGINYHDGTTPNVTLGYSPLGLRTMMTDGMGTTLYTYDSLDRLTQSQVQFAGGPLKTVGYGYDLADNLTSLAYPDSFGLPSLVVSRVHNKANRLTSVSDWLSNTSTFGYDADGNVTSIAYPNGAHATYAYDNADRISAITQTVTTTTFLALNYTRDGVGNLASAAEAGLGTGSYTYDALDRLAKDRLTAGSPLTRTWAYDGAYQVTDTKIEPGTGAVITTTRAYNPANELISLLERTGGVLSKQVAFTYDAKGNRKTQADGVNPPSITYSYDQANRLTSYVRGAAQTDYGYNGDGLRGKKAPVGGLPDYFAWNLAGSLPMLLQDGSASYVYGPGGSILEQVPTGASQAYFYHNDQLGSVRALTGPSGSRAATYNYDAYGVPITATGTLTNPFRYAGEYTDAESGLVYLRARHYDPSTQQFLTRDPIVAQTGQAYTYASGNPLNRVDPSGLDTGGYPNSGHSSAEGVFKYARPEPSSAVLADASHPQVVDLECK